MTTSEEQLEADRAHEALVHVINAVEAALSELDAQRVGQTAAPHLDLAIHLLRNEAGISSD